MNAEFITHTYVTERTILMIKKLILLGFIFCLSGCGTTFESAGRYKLLANISKGDNGKYKVDAFSNEKGNVDLNNVQFTGDTADTFCGSEDNTDRARRYGREYERVKCSENEEFFKEKTTFVGGNTQTREVNLVFSRGRFEGAVEEALLTSKIDRIKIINSYDAYVERHDKKVEKFTLAPDKFSEFLTK